MPRQAQDKRKETLQNIAFARLTQHGRVVAMRQRLERTEWQSDGGGTDSGEDEDKHGEEEEEEEEEDDLLWHSRYANDESAKLKFVGRHLIGCLQKRHAKKIKGSEFFSLLLRDCPTVDKEVRNVARLCGASFTFKRHFVKTGSEQTCSKKHDTLGIAGRLPLTAGGQVQLLQGIRGET